MWKNLTLGDICIATQGVQIPKRNQIKHFKDGYKRYLYISDFKNDRNLKYVEDIYPKKIVTSDDLIVSNTGSQGEVYKGIEGILSNNLFKVSFNRENLDKDFLFYFLKSPLFINFQKDRTRGSTQPHMGHRNFLSTPISLPPLSEQQHIVAKLDDVFSEIDKAKKADQYILLEINKLKECIIESSLSKMNLENYKYKLQDLLDLGWIESHLDGNHGSDYPRKNEFIDSGVPYISANCLNNGSVTKINMKFLSKDRASRLRKGIAKNGDILFAHNATVGPTALLETHESKVILGTSLTYYRCQKQKINNKYLMIYMQSRLFIDQYKFVMRQATRNQVPITKQRKFDFIIPPLEMQLSISEKILKIEKYIKKLSFDIEKRKRQYDSLKSVILSREFKLETI